MAEERRRSSTNTITKTSHTEIRGKRPRIFWDYLRHASRSLLICRVNSNSSTYPAYVGGNYNTNANYGLFYFNGNNSATNTNANLGSRHLVIKKIIAQISPYRSVKILLLGQGLVGFLELP